LENNRNKHEGILSILIWDSSEGSILIIGRPISFFQFSFEIHQQKFFSQDIIRRYFQFSFEIHPARAVQWIGTKESFLSILIWDSSALEVARLRAYGLFFQFSFEIHRHWTSWRRRSYPCSTFNSHLRFIYN